MQLVQDRFLKSVVGNCFNLDCSYEDEVYTFVSTTIFEKKGYLCVLKNLN